MAQPAHRPQDRWTSIQTVAAVVGAIAAVVGVVVAVAVAQGKIGGSSSDDVDQAVEEALRNPNTQQVEAPVSQGVAPTETSSSPFIQTQLTLAVVNYCFCEGPRGQAQVKVKPRIVNHSGDTVPLRAENLRLLVPKPLPGEWTPPRAAGEIVELSVGDGTVLAIPPNADGAAEQVGEGLTFATHWNQTSLTAGSEYVDRRVKEGDLVYYLPRQEDGSMVIIGLAHVTNTSDGTWQVTGFVDSNDWQGDADPNLF